MNAQDYPKGMLLVGKGPSGKTLLQTFIAAGHRKENIVEINGRNGGRSGYDSFLFKDCTPETTLIIVDDVKTQDLLLTFYPLLTEGITAERKGREEQFIPPGKYQLIASMDIPLEEVKRPVLRRFHVIEVSKCGYTL